MIPDHVTGPDITKSGTAVGALSDLPSSFPAWAKQLAELYNLIDRLITSVDVL